MTSSSNRPTGAASGKAADTPPSGDADAPVEVDVPKPDTTDPAAGRPSTIAAIGASAGGLAVFNRLFNLVRPDAEVAYIVISHLDPHQASLLPELIGHHTKLVVEKAAHGATIQAGHVYVIPPNQYLTIEKGHIVLSALEDARGRRFPIDVCLRSLAADQGENAVAVILTGTGADGTDGIHAIKESGGTVIVQDPTTAEYSGMPDSAIATGVVDLVLPVEEIAAMIAGYASRQYPGARDFTKEPTKAEAQLRTVFALMRSRGDSFDYRPYKTGTLMRRLSRRMALNHKDNIAAYCEVLRKGPVEIQRLRKDLLIGVTHFFRDAEAWQTLEEEVLPHVFEDKAADRPVRVWVPGCSSGEEVYSLVMLLIEQRSALGLSNPIQVFATDVNPDALDIARAGLYDKSSVSQISPERVARFFVEESPHQFRVTKELRQPIAFAIQNCLSDPPFSNMDLVSCRNLLIYLRPDAQKRLVDLFHFALRPDGHLFLGNSESIGSSAGTFETIDKKWRIFRRTGAPRLRSLEFPLAETTTHAIDSESPPGPGKGVANRLWRAREPALAESAQRWLVARYAPASVVINKEHDILYLNGPVEDYLELPRGEPMLNLVAFARGDLRGRLRVALQHAAKADDGRAETTFHLLQADRSRREITVEVEPFVVPGHCGHLSMVTLSDGDTVKTGLHRPQVVVSPDDETIVAQLEAELALTRHDLQGTIEALETANEELKATNEEIMSMNEEFRSANEELETSKEEMQSLNEELTTVNAELNEKVTALEIANNDILNLLTSTEIPTLFLDADNRIRRYTPATTALLNLISTDVGRPLSDINIEFEDPRLHADIARVDRTLAPAEAIVRARDGRRHIRRVRPYRTIDQRVDGVVITYLDVESMKKAEDEVRDAKRFAEDIVTTIREPLLVLDSDLRIKSANRSFYKTFQRRPDNTIDRALFELGDGEWDLPAVREALEKNALSGKEMRNFEVRQTFEGAGPRVLLLTVRPIGNPDTDAAEAEAPAGDEAEAPPRHGGLILVAIHDISQRVGRERLEREQFVTKKLVRRMLRHATLGSASPHVRRDLGHGMADEAAGETIDEYVQAFQLMGLGEMAYEGEHDGQHVFNGRDLLEVTPGHGATTCHLTLGYLEAAIGRLSGTAGLGSETACQSNGHLGCRFVVMPRKGATGKPSNP